MTRPRIRPRYSVDVLGNIRERLTSLAGFPAFCFEMLQNAEDAESEWIELRFHDDCLEVANASEFSQDDWNRITEIAHAGKPAENIGTFGVGFTSVFQYTDEPSILSSGMRVTFSLARIAAGEENTILHEDAEHPAGTTFVIPWAFQYSAVRERLDQPTVSPDSIGQYFGLAREAVENGLLFLKHLRHATLRRGKNIFHMQRSDEPLGDSAIRRTITIRSEPDTAAETRDWLLRRSFPEPRGYPECDKVPEIALALPITPTHRDDEGLLYSFLPTQHATGLPCHVHGSFFAKSDRKGIERDGESDHVRWNTLLLDEVSSLYTQSLYDLVEHVSYQSALRVLPPHTYESPGLPELIDLVDRVVEAVKDGLPLLRDRHCAVASPEDLFLAADLPDHLLDVAEACGARFAHRLFHHSIGWLRNFGVQPIRHSDLPSLPLFDALSDVDDFQLADERFHEESFRGQVYELVAHLLDQAEDESETDTTLSSLCCAVGSRGSVVPLDCLWVASDLEYRTFADTFSGDKFWRQSDQQALPESLLERLPAFSVLDATRHLVNDAAFDAYFAENPERLSRLYDCVVAWTKDGVTNKEREALRNAPIWHRADRRLVPLRELDLPSTGFSDPLDLGVVFSHPLTGSASSDTVQAIRGALTELGAKPLSFRSYCTKHLPSYVTSHKHESDMAASKRYVQVLDVLRTELRRFQDDEEIRRVLSDLAIIPSTDESFYTASELYWPSDVLDAVFGEDKYPTPDHDMTDVTPSWEEFYTVLGIETTPRIIDVVDRIKTLAGSEATNERNESLRNLFQYLDDAAEDWSDEDAERVETLRDVACLPAHQSSEGLATPSSCYTSDMRTLVGSQGRCVSFSFRPRAALRDALGLHDSVTPAVVVANLKDSVANERFVLREIYQYLNDNAADPAVRALRDVPCVDIGDGRVLKGSHIFFDPVPFGKYRYHLPEELAEFTDLFDALGVRHSRDIDPGTLVEVLRDIAKEWSPGNRVPDSSTQDVVQHVLVKLSAYIGSESKSALKDAVASITDLKCVPRKDGLLVKPSELVLKDHQAYAKEFSERLGNSLIDKQPSTCVCSTRSSASKCSVISSRSNFAIPISASCTAVRRMSFARRHASFDG